MILNLFIKIALDNDHLANTIDEHYNLITDNYGGDRSLDIADGNPVWQTIYLDGLQMLYNLDVRYYIKKN